MKKWIVLLSLITMGMFFSQCGKNQEDIDSENIAEIENYLIANNLTAEKTSTDLYYIIENEGNGDSPSASSDVTVDYRGYYTDGQQFDSSYTRGRPATFNLGNVIPGWTEGIPLFSKGGSGKLLIPSKLGYGDEPPGSIRSNAVLVFDIELHDF